MACNAGIYDMVKCSQISSSACTQCGMNRGSWDGITSRYIENKRHPCNSKATISIYIPYSIHGGDSGNMLPRFSIPDVDLFYGSRRVNRGLRRVLREKIKTSPNGITRD